MGMARPGTVDSSLPQAAIDDGITDEEFLEDEEFVEDDAEQDAAAAEEAAIEAEARSQGWRPLAEYRGKPGGWKTARQFVEDGKNFLPFVQKQRDELMATVAHMTTEMTGMRGELAQTQKQMQQLLEYSRRASQAGYEKAVAELKAKQRNAVAEGDTATFDAIESQLGQMEEARNEVQDGEPVAEPQPQPKPAASLPQEVLDFIDANAEWYLKDRTLNSAMIAEHNRIIEESPGLSLADQLEAAKEAVMARFPKKFGLKTQTTEPPTPPARRPAAPLGPTPPPGPRGGPRGRTGIEAIADPRERAEAREGFLRAQRNMPGVTEEEFLEILNDPHADVLEVQRKHRKPAQRGK